MIALGVWTNRGTGMKSLRVALCGAAIALLAAASPAQATTTVVSGTYTGGYQSTGGSFSLGEGSYLISLSFSNPVSDFDGTLEKTYAYDAYCNFGAGDVLCGGDDVPIDLTFNMVTPQLYQLLLTINGPETIVIPPGHFESREDTHESCCGFGFGFTSSGSGHFVLSYADVPEPATWAMMLIGFGAIGAAARRRQTRNVLATS